MYDILDDPKDNEKFGILFVGENFDDEALEEYIKMNLGDEAIKEITVDSIVVYDNIYYDYLQTRCYNYDLIIISESYMKDYVGRVVFERDILVSDLGEVLPECSYYYENIDGNDYVFGLVVGDENTDNLFSKYYTGEEKCYLFLSPQSVNLDQINGKGEKGDDFALRILNALFEK